MDRVATEKLKWKCRRGLLELDLVLQKYLRNHLEEAGGRDEGGLNEVLVELLDLPDNDLWDIVIGRSNAYDPKYERIVARLRAT